MRSDLRYPRRAESRQRAITKHQIRKKKTGPIDIGEPYDYAGGERALWVAVITQAVMDALSRAPSSEALYHKHEAIRWLMDGSRDFITVCQHAGYEPDYIRKCAKRALSSPNPWRALPGQGNRYLERRAYRARQKIAALHQQPVEALHVVPGPWAMA